MHLLQKKVIKKLAIIYWLLPLFIALLSYDPCLAAEEDPLLNLTPSEASGFLNRLIANPSLMEKLTAERRAQLTSSEVFQKTILNQQKDLLTRRNLSQSSALKKVVTNLYAPNSEIREKFESLSAFSERLEYLVATGNISSLIETRRITDLLPEEKQLLDLSLMGFIRSSIVEKLSAHRAPEAMEYLIQLPEELWIAEGRTLATQVFAGMVKDEASFSSDQVDRFSTRMASLFEADPTSRAAVLGIFETSAFSASDRGDKAETLKLTTQIRKFYDNKLPSLFVEQLLLEHPAGLDSEVSSNLIAELKERNELPLKLKLKLMWDGYFGPLVPVLVGLSLFFISMSVLTLIVISARKKFADIQIANPFKSKKIIPGYMRPIEVESRENEDEYTRLLALFNLSDTATESEIKRAYRNRMKELHPDSGKNDLAVDNSEEFRDLKHAHDRIIEIRSAWFQGRKSK